MTLGSRNEIYHIGGEHLLRTEVQIQSSEILKDEIMWFLSLKSDFGLVNAYKVMFAMKKG